MSFKNLAGITGALLVIAGGLLPMLRLPIIGNWNYWDIDTSLAVIVYSLALLALIAAAGNKNGLLKFCGWALLFLLIFTFAAVQFKATDYFSFIPFKKLAAIASKIVQIRWTGWSTIFAGSIIIILFSGRSKKRDSSE
ncbi:MAG: hypothetical protein WC380_02755 [Pedobacter sp.]|jgi:hypothetical protein